MAGRVPGPDRPHCHITTTATSRKRFVEARHPVFVSLRRMGVWNSSLAGPFRRSYECHSTCFSTFIRRSKLTLFGRWHWSELHA
jgi:hypothetical protein